MDDKKRDRKFRVDSQSKETNILNKLQSPSVESGDNYRQHDRFCFHMEEPTILSRHLRCSGFEPQRQTCHEVAAVFPCNESENDRISQSSLQHQAMCPDCSGI